MNNIEQAITELVEQVLETREGDLADIVDEAFKDKAYVTKDELESAVESAIEDADNNGDLVTNSDLDKTLNDYATEDSVYDTAKEAAKEVLDDNLEDAVKEVLGDAKKDILKTVLVAIQDAMVDLQADMDKPKVVGPIKPTYRQVCRACESGPCETRTKGRYIVVGIPDTVCPYFPGTSQKAQWSPVQEVVQ
jgi:hypothetical protein